MAEYTQDEKAAALRAGENWLETDPELLLMGRFMDDHGDPSTWSQAMEDLYMAEHNVLMGNGAVPSGCQHCGIPEREHARRWTDGIGWHPWVQPRSSQTLARMKARRAARATNSLKDGAR
ncbi:hypothetical protein [Kitasatospora sp. NPDC056531]|uniref:hypothetical protein n=1 Tax=Kitasatospora sp. NPDC056531 TaxID=3345856 RepID=UPI0036B6E63E